MSTHIISEYIDEFLDCLESKNGVYNSIDEKEKEFCSKLAYDFTNATITDTSSDVFSFYLLSRLNDFIYNSIKKNKSFYVDEDNSKLSLSYYEILKDEFDSHKTENNFDDIKWIKNILVYIDNQGLMFQYVNDVALLKSKEMIEQSRQSIYESVLVANKAEKKANEALTNSKNALNEQKKIKTKQKNLNKRANQLNGNINKAIKSIDNIIPHMLTSLGIFVSIIIAVVVVYLSDLISISGNVPPYITQFQFARYLMSGHIIFNIVFLMLYLISRLTNKTVLLRCSEYESLEKYEKFRYRPCANCKKQKCGECNFIKKLWKKATYMVGINLICCAGYLFLYDWWYIENFLWSEILVKIDRVIVTDSTPNLLNRIIYIFLFNLFFILLFFGIKYLFVTKTKKQKTGEEEKEKKEKKKTLFKKTKKKSN